MAHFWRLIPNDLDRLTLREYRRMELFAIQATKTLDSEGGDADG